MEKLKNGTGEIKDKPLHDLLVSAGADMTEYEGGDHILTDDRAPVELLGMHEIDGLIQGEVGNYKELFRKNGIKGILNY